jgi:hypothetical protein|tara:strand:+ start:196 stop:1896 length:1701 start_codon:yes stop_codon:yes gene_type:complete
MARTFLEGLASGFQSQIPNILAARQRREAEEKRTKEALAELKARYPQLFEEFAASRATIKDSPIIPQEDPSGIPPLPMTQEQAAAAPQQTIPFDESTLTMGDISGLMGRFARERDESQRLAAEQRAESQRLATEQRAAARAEELAAKNKEEANRIALERARQGYATSAALREASEEEALRRGVPITTLQPSVTGGEPKDLTGLLAQTGVQEFKAERAMGLASEQIQADREAKQRQEAENTNTRNYILSEFRGREINKDQLNALGLSNLPEDQRRDVINKLEVRYALTQKDKQVTPSVAVTDLKDTLKGNPLNEKTGLPYFKYLGKDFWSTQEGVAISKSPVVAEWLNRRISQGEDVPHPANILKTISEETSSVASIKKLQDETAVLNAVSELNSGLAEDAVREGLTTPKQKALFDKASTALKAGAKESESMTARGWAEITSYLDNSLTSVGKNPNLVTLVNIGGGQRVTVPLYRMKVTYDKDGNAFREVVPAPLSIINKLPPAQQEQLKKAIRDEERLPDTGDANWGEPQKLKSGNDFLIQPFRGNPLPNANTPTPFQTPMPPLPQ